MSTAESILDFSADFVRGVGSIFAKSHATFVDIETTDGPNAFATVQGALVSVIEIEGSMRMIGPDEFNALMSHLYHALNPTLARAGHRLQFVIVRDPDAIRRDIDEALVGTRSTVERLDLSMHDVLDSRAARLAQYCAQERTYLAVWTTPDRLTKTEIRGAVAEQKAEAATLPFGRESQRLTRASSSMRNAHNALCEGLMGDLGAADILVRMLNVHDIVYMLRRRLIPEMTDLRWRACLPGDPVPTRMKEIRSPNDFSHVLYPTIDAQILPDGAGSMLGPRLQVIGNRVHAPVMLTLPPQDTKPFQALFNRLLDSGIPYAVSFSLTPDGLAQMGMRHTMARMLNFLPGVTNKQINMAIEEMHARKTGGENVVGLRIVAETWAPADDVNLVMERSSMISRALQGWGSCDTSDVVGDPLMGVFATLPGVGLSNPAPVSAPTLMEAMTMLPVTRPASPWREGSMLLRSPDGKVLPYQPGSTLQTAWVNLGFAPMGFGKSVFLNALNNALATRPGIERLPYIMILDIGVSSAGLISMLKYALPRDQRHLVQYYRLSDKAKDAINVFDTPVGLRKPLSEHREFLVSFLTLLCTPIGEQKPFDGIAGISRMIVDMVYESLDDHHSPKRYDPARFPAIHTIVEGLDVIIDRETSWFEVTDALFSAGYTHEAGITHKHAMPTLSDCASAAKHDAIASIYRDVTPQSLPISDYVWRSIVEAINKFPNLSMSTAFDVGDSRIVSLDLQDVAPSGGPQADRQTSIMYMVARRVLGQKFFMLMDDVNLFPEIYRDHYERHIRETGSDAKAICMDEFHRTAGAQAVRDQVIRDIREGRKWKVLISLFSQLPEDFDETMIDLATSVFILGAGSEEGASKVARIFGLNATELNIIKNRIRKPGRHGSSMLAIHKTSRGRVSQFAYLTLAPEEMWAYSTTAEDRRIRDTLYEKFDPSVVRRALARMFPGGTATDEIERRRAKIDETGERVDLIEAIIVEMEEMARSMIASEYA